VLHQDFRRQGWRCRTCGALATKTHLQCVLCGGSGAARWQIVLRGVGVTGSYRATLSHVPGGSNLGRFLHKYMVLFLTIVIVSLVLWDRGYPLWHRAKESILFF
jgi:hypothetical protein